MTYSTKQTLITVFSIIAMLMSSYVSGMPMMVMQGSQVNLDPGFQVTSVESDTDCHSHTLSSPDTMAQASTLTSEHQTSASTKHCGSAGGADSCCISLCATASYPLQSTQTLSGLLPSLALHRTVKIGVKVKRVQTLLRPPSHTFNI